MLTLVTQQRGRQALMARTDKIRDGEREASQLDALHVLVRLLARAAAREAIAAAPESTATSVVKLEGSSHD